MDVLVNGTAVSLLGLQETLVRDTLEENIVPILFSASASVFALGA
jgi:hypothetical protein